MKKALFFLPAIIFIVFCLWVSVFAGVGSVDWGEAIIFAAPLVIAGLLLCKNIFWGGIVGMLPAIYLISFGKNTYTGIEFPIGIVLLFFYLICVFILFYSKIHRNKF